MEQVILQSITVDQLVTNIKQAVLEELSKTYPIKDNSITKDRKYSSAEVMEEYRICKRTLQNRMKDGTLKFHRTGRKLYFLESELQQAFPAIQLRRK